MKSKVFVVLAILAVALWATAASAATLSILESPTVEGQVSVTAIGFNSTFSNYSTGYETASGYVYLSNDGFNYDHSATVVLTEAGGGVSDFLTLYTLDTYLSPFILHFNFESDGASHFANHVAGLNDVVAYVSETGGPQDLTSYFACVLGTSGVQIFAQSDVSAVPVPPSALLMGSGLLGLVGLGWRRRNS